MMTDFQYEQLFALVFGVGKYQPRPNGDQLEELLGIPATVETAAEWLTSLGVEVDKKLDPTRAEIEAAVDELCTKLERLREVSPSKKYGVILYFAGHGSRPTEFTAAEFHSSDYPIAFVRFRDEYMRDRLSKLAFHSLLVLDCCHANSIQSASEPVPASDEQFQAAYTPSSETSLSAPTPVELDSLQKVFRNRAAVVATTAGSSEKAWFHKENGSTSLARIISCQKQGVIEDRDDLDGVIPTKHLVQHLVAKTQGDSIVRFFDLDGFEGDLVLGLTPKTSIGSKPLTTNKRLIEVERRTDEMQGESIKLKNDLAGLEGSLSEAKSWLFRGLTTIAAVMLLLFGWNAMQQDRTGDTVGGISRYVVDQHLLTLAQELRYSTPMPPSWKLQLEEISAIAEDIRARSDVASALLKLDAKNSKYAIGKKPGQDEVEFYKNLAQQLELKHTGQEEKGPIGVLLKFCEGACLDRYERLAKLMNEGSDIIIERKSDEVFLSIEDAAETYEFSALLVALGLNESRQILDSQEESISPQDHHRRALAYFDRFNRAEDSPAATLRTVNNVVGADIRLIRASLRSLKANDNQLAPLKVAVHLLKDARTKEDVKEITLWREWFKRVHGEKSPSERKAGSVGKKWNECFGGELAGLALIERSDRKAEAYRDTIASFFATKYAILTHYKIEGEELDTAVGDFVASLKYFADAGGWDFQKMKSELGEWPAEQITDHIVQEYNAPIVKEAEQDGNSKTDG